MKKILPIFTACCIVLIAAGLVRAHCQIPCGIYDDQMRVHMIAEHIKTIEKSMNEIMRLEKEGPKNYNQLVRWIMNKDDHADRLKRLRTRVAYR